MSEQKRDLQPPEAGSTPEPVALGPYRIYELIGAGGMAEVYRAARTDASGLEQPVVIKRVKPKHAGDPGFIRMFLDEARLSSQLRHPNIVEVFEFGEIDGHHYIAMEYLDGLHLQAAHVRHVQLFGQPLPWEASVLIVRDVLRGLHYAHGKRDEQGRPLGLVHRDINLVNVMLDRSGTVKVLDFGIVKAADGIRSAETVGGVLKGKFGYMSPEQAEGRPLDPRSDVFSAAIVLHELLTGRRLFWGEDDLAILRKVRAGEIPDPRQYRETVPEALVQVTCKGLARVLEDRYFSAADMADALDEVAREQEIAETTVRHVMRTLLPAAEEGPREAMRRKRRKLTLAAWRQGVREAEQHQGAAAAGMVGAPAGSGELDSSAASGELGSPAAPGELGAPAASGEVGIPAEPPATELGKKKTLPLPAVSETLEGSTLITTDVRWLLPEGGERDTEVEPVLGEQDVTAVTGARIGDGTVDESTLILVGSSQDEPLTEAERALFPPAEGTRQALSLQEQQTRLPGGEAALGRAATSLEARERVSDRALDRADGGEEVERQASPPGETDPGRAEERSSSSRRGIRLGLAVLLALALAALLVVLWTRFAGR